MRRLKGMSIFCSICFVLSTVLITSGIVVHSAEAENIIKIGTINPLSGPAANWGNPPTRGLTILAEILNENGGITINGKKFIFKIYAENDKYSAQGARASIEKLISQENIKYIVGSWYDATVFALRGISNEKKILVLQGSTGDPNTLGPEYPYLFRYTQDPRGKLGALDVALKQGLMKDSMAIINDDTALGRGNSKSAAEWAAENSIEITQNIIVPVDAQDFYPYLKKIIDSKTKMIHGALPPGKFAIACKQANELGYKGFYSNVGALTSVEDMIDIAGKEAIEGYIAPFEDMRCPAITEENRQLMAKMKEIYLEKYGPPFEPLSWRYAPGLQILSQAMEKAQSLDPEVLVKVIENMKFDTLLGSGKFEGKQTYGITRQLEVNTIVGIIKDGKIEYLGFTKVKRP